MFQFQQSRSPPAGGPPAVAPVRLAHSFTHIQFSQQTLFVYIGYTIFVSQTNVDVQLIFLYRFFSQRNICKV